MLGGSGQNMPEHAGSRISELSPRKRAALKQFLSGSGVRAAPIAVIPREGEIPLSFAQQRLWFLEQLEPGRSIYNVPAVVRIRGALDLEILAWSFQKLVRRHESLRTSFRAVDGRPVQAVAAEMELAPDVRDLSALAVSEREAKAWEVAREETNRAFDLARGPLLRVAVLRLAPEEALVVFVMHHIACDARSLEVLLRDVTAYYMAAVAGGREPALPALRCQYADFSAWQRKYLEGEVLERQLSYWRRQLEGLAPLEVPADYARPAMQSFRGARESMALPDAFCDRLRAFSRQHDVTLFMTMLAAFQTLLHRYTGQDDIAVGTPIAGRTRPETRELIGFFVNTLVMRTDLSGDPTFAELLGRVRETALGAYDHQHLPFERLVEELRPPRDPSRSPLFQVMFTSDGFQYRNRHIGDLTVEFLEVEPRTARFDLTLAMVEWDGGLKLRMDYSTDLFEAATARRMLGHFRTLLEAAIDDPTQRISTLPMLDAPERRQLLLEFNEAGEAAGSADIPPLHRLFQAQAARTPDAAAVAFEGERLTFRELNRRANGLARRLRELGVGPDVLVGLCVNRSLEMVVGLLGILKAGGAYVPMDPAYPADRLSFLIEDTRMPVLVTEPALADKVPPHGTQVVCLDASLDEEDENVAGAASATDIAYVIYTSGTTGAPKGVLVEHRSAANYVRGIREALGLEPGWSYAMVQPLTVDSSVTAIYPPLLGGGCLHVISRERSLDPEALGDYFGREGIDVLKIAPSHLSALLAAGRPERLLPRRCLVIGGEASRRDWAERLQSLAPGCRIFNHYGPTEATVGVTTYPAGSGGSAASVLPIGRPLPGCRVYVLDAHRQLAPIGVPGELYIGGGCLARGYLNRPELTAEKFVPDPFSGEPGARLYRTGDVARWRPSGVIEFLGRRDHQVKVRGYRVEPAEIEAALGRYPDVREAIVVAARDAQGGERLAAYVVPQPGRGPGATELRRYLLAKLPSYMAPSTVMVLPELPRTPHGKVDRGALPPPGEARLEPEGGFPGPRGELEIRMARIWERVLGVRPVGSGDNFFEIGGHSLLAVSLFAEIEKAFGERLPLATLFEHPTVEGLAGVLRDRGRPRRWSSLVPLQPDGANPPLFCVHGNGGNVLFYRDLARRLAPDQPVYALQSVGLDGTRPPLTRVEDMAVHYIEEIRSLQPEGPYLLAGICLGAYVALEMAHQLEARGQRVALLASLNTDGGWRTVKSFWDGVRFHRRNLSRLGPTGGITYIVERARYRLLRIGVAVATLLSSFRRHPGGPLPAHLAHLRVYTTNSRASAEYVPRSFQGRLVCFQASGDTYTKPHMFWDAFAAGGVEIQVVPGKRDNVLKEPHVAVLARQLKVCLERARAEAIPG
jgi:amino acid adenylation domain-containing protein